MAERRFEAPNSELDPIREELGTEEEEKALVRNPRRRSAKAALELKMMGANFVEIAKVLEFESPSAARMAVESALIESGHGDADKESIRSLMGLQLDQWHKSIATKIVDSKLTGQLEYMAMGLRLMERKARLFGIDAPTKVELHNADDHEIQALIGAYQERLGLSRPEEGDPFELVEGEDGVWQQADGMDVEDDDDE